MDHSLFAYCLALSMVIGVTLSACPGAFDCESDDGQCVSTLFKCDGDADCRNGHDEHASVCDPNFVKPPPEVPECKENQYQCRGETSCIQRHHVCNGVVECPQGDDEENCDTNHCRADTEFRCNTGRCIAKSWECDGEIDCGDGTDEDEANCEGRVCPEGRLRCGNDTTKVAECVPKEFWCDSSPDCINGEDEADCPNGVRCPTGYLRCANNMTCYHESDRCDGEAACPDSSDEHNCPKSTTPISPSHKCGSLEVMCHDGLGCYQSDHRCDGDFDCDDRSDELGCTCPDNKFKCAIIHNCIPKDLLCSGLTECLDGSDELGCAVEPLKCKEAEFYCNRTRKCIPMDKVCNNHYDCSMGEDEENCKAHACLNSPCQYCDDTHHLGTCYCPKGYRLDSSGHKCIDIDECQIPGSCSQICENTEGNFTCNCGHPGLYELHNGTFCKAIGDRPPRLLYANRENLRSVELVGPLSSSPTESDKRVLDHAQLVQGEDIRWVTYDHKKSVIYYTESITETVKSVSPNGEKIDWRVPTHSPGGLAYDWVHGNLYVSDGMDLLIRVVNVADSRDGNVADNIVDLYEGSKAGFQETRALVVYPKKAWIFFSDWHQNKIFRGGMDGGELLTVYHYQHSWANGLAIDLSNERLYWADAGLRGIFSSDLHGQAQRMVMKPTEKLVSPFGLTLFEDTMYWSDRNKTKIFQASKYRNGEDMKEVVTFTHAMDVTVYHSALQPEYPNLCREHKCAHICLPSPSKISTQVASYSCRCRRGYYQPEDNPRACLKIATPAAQIPAAQTGSLSQGTVALIAAGVVMAIAICALVVGVRYYRHRQAKKYAPRVMILENSDSVYSKTSEPIRSGRNRNRELTEDLLPLPENEELSSQSGSNVTSELIV